MFVHILLIYGFNAIKRAKERYNMARGRKSYQTQLDALEAQITKAQDKLNNLKVQKEAILSKQREEELSELYQVMKDNNLTTDDILDIIQKEEQ